MSLEDIKNTVKTCQKCHLHKSRKNAVPGEGSLEAEILIIGESPGAMEDNLGRPFVGKAGKLLDKALEHIKLKREEVFITNLVKCRPPNNRDPLPEEIDTCKPYLDNQIEIIQPEIIVPLGKFASQSILKTSNPMKQMRGRLHSIQVGKQWIKVFPTYHPAAVTYNSKIKDVFFEDFEMFKNLI